MNIWLIVCVCLFIQLLQINGSLARAAMRELAAEGLIKVVAKSAQQSIYTRATKEVDAWVWRVSFCNLGHFFKKK